MGYESCNFLKNMSTVSIYILFCYSKIFIYLILWIISKVFKFKIIKKIVKRWKFFKLVGELIRVCLESYMELLIAGFMAIKANLWGKTGDVVGNILAYFFLSIVIFVLPFFVSFITITEKDSIKSKKLKYVCR